MLRIWLWTVGSVVLASAIPLAGLWLARLHPPAVERMLPALVSFAVGALLGGAMLHLLPEALAGPLGAPSSPFYEVAPHVKR